MARRIRPVAPGTPPRPGGQPVHDSAAKWTARPDWTSARIERDGWRVRPVAALSQVLVSGDTSAALAAWSPGAAMAGLWAVAETDPVAVRIARDRLLLVGSEPLALPSGWSGGWAASPAHDAWFVAEIEGPATIDIVREGTSADLEAGSPSAAVVFAGIPALLYRTAEQVARLHVEGPFGPYLWRWLEERED